MNSKVSKKSIKDAIVGYMNPYHVQYIKVNPLNTIDKLTDALNKIEENKLRDILGVAYMSYYASEMSSRKSDFQNVEVMKRNLVNKSIDIANLTSEHVAVNAFTTMILNHFISVGNPLTLKEREQKIKSHIESFKYNKEQLKSKVKEMLNKQNLQEDDDLESSYLNTLNFMKDSLEKLRDNQSYFLSLYNEFCDIVIKDLIEEKINII